MPQPKVWIDMARSDSLERGHWQGLRKLLYPFCPGPRNKRRMGKAGVQGHETWLPHVQIRLREKLRILGFEVRWKPTVPVSDPAEGSGRRSQDASCCAARSFAGCRMRLR